jgi:hypothetical protein
MEVVVFGLETVDIGCVSDVMLRSSTSHRCITYISPCLLKTSRSWSSFVAKLRLPIKTYRVHAVFDQLLFQSASYDPRMFVWVGQRKGN